MFQKSIVLYPLQYVVHESQCQSLKCSRGGGRVSHRIFGRGGGGIFTECPLGDDSTMATVKGRVWEGVWCGKGRVWEEWVWEGCVPPPTQSTETLKYNVMWGTWILRIYSSDGSYMHIFKIKNVYCERGGDYYSLNNRPPPWMCVCMCLWFILSRLWDISYWHYVSNIL